MEGNAAVWKLKIMITLYNTVNCGGWCSSACKLGCNFPLVSAKQMIMGLGQWGRERATPLLYVQRLIPSATGTSPALSFSFSVLLSCHLIRASFCFPHYVSCVFFFICVRILLLRLHLHASCMHLAYSNSIQCIYTSVSQPVIWLLLLVTYLKYKPAH